MLFLLLVVAVFSQKKEICMPSKYEMLMYLVNPEKKFDDIQQVYFDLDLQRMRVDLFMMDPIERFIQTFQFFDQKRMYMYDIKTDECWMEPLEMPMQKECLSRGAVLEGELKVGSMTCEHYREYITADEEVGIMLQKGNDYPISVTIFGVDRKKSKAADAIHAEYFNLGTSFNSTEKFTLPKACL